ncbi:MAG: GNAT family N-acetyltransferase [Propionibacteriaceae bacterium]|jgi:RimJ/RimL family protein N-acetyltransferase|nr:GNAT family N-acetyltransferase [Propionibacteriaceae bacterium]
MNDRMILTTDRLTLREMTQADLPALTQIMADPITMTAYEGAFTDVEIQDWLDRQLQRYHEDGFGLWAVILTSEDRMIGQCGLTRQQIGDAEVVEVGYLFNRAYWHHGYAIEAARACRDYAFTTLGVDEVYSTVRVTNLASMNVAIRNQMTIRTRYVKHYRGIDMPHYAFAVTRPWKHDLLNRAQVRPERVLQRFPRPT